jgi:hypothetical protein
MVCRAPYGWDEEAFRSQFSHPSPIQPRDFLFADRFRFLGSGGLSKTDVMVFTGSIDLQKHFANKGAAIRWSILK